MLEKVKSFQTIVIVAYQCEEELQSWVGVGGGEWESSQV